MEIKDPALIGHCHHGRRACGKNAALHLCEKFRAARRFPCRLKLRVINFETWDSGI
jgi:hypothetical protein